MTEFDPEAYLEQQLQGGGEADAAPMENGERPIPPPPPLVEERPTEERRRSRSRDRNRDSGRGSDRRDSGRGGDRGGGYRSRDNRPRYDDNYRYEGRSGGGGGGGGGRVDRSAANKDTEDGFERDLRTVFIAQVARKADERDLFAFFCECGKVTDVRIIKDTQTRRSKGIAYVEFETMESCPGAVAKSGQIICGFPCIIQASQAEKNIAAKQAAQAAALADQPARINLSNLHKDIGQDDVQALFSPFGQVMHASIQRDPSAPTNRGVVTFKEMEEAKKAVGALNGFDLAGLPPYQPMPSECMLLVNMFDPSAETEPNWHVEIQDDVSDECSKFGAVLKCVVDRASPNGMVYLKFQNPDSSFKAAQALNGRFFAGKAISALYLSKVVFEKFCPINP